MDPRLQILVLEADPKSAEEFLAAAEAHGEVTVFPSLDQLLSESDRFDPRVVLLDVATLQQTPTAHVERLRDARGRFPIALITDRDLEDYLYDLRRWGLVQCCVKVSPVDPFEVGCFLRSVRDAASGFGLLRYMAHTVEMYHVSISTIAEKNDAVERVINHFASSGFDIHELYDVRLILEEVLNNAFFHAFKTPTGEEKYSINSFDCLEAGEKVQIEYGNSGSMAGFAVTDNAGTLPIRTVISKLERQLNRDGLFDVSGRGLYLSRMFTSAFIMNIEQGKRTQVVALFDERRRSSRPKPFIINHLGEDCYDEWCLDPDLD